MPISESEYLNVEICATLLTDKPPKLPLREELQSLGFEIIYNGRGVGAKTAEIEAERAVKHFQKSVQAKDLKKRRFFPKSSKYIKEKLAERKRIEKELRTPHAFSYESYEYQLYEDGGTESSFSSRSSSSEESTRSWNGVKFRKSARKRKGWGLFRKTKSADCDVPTASFNFSSHGEMSMEDLFDEAAFRDILAPDDDTEVDMIQPHSAGVGIFDKEHTGSTTTEMSGTTAEPASLASSTRKDGLHNMEIQFDSSAGDMYEMSVVDESEAGSQLESKGLDDRKQQGLSGSVKNAFADRLSGSVKNAFADLDSKYKTSSVDESEAGSQLETKGLGDRAQQGLNGSVKNAFADLDSKYKTSSVDEPEAGSQLETKELDDSVKNAFADVDAKGVKDWPTQSPTGVENAFAGYHVSSPVYTAGSTPWQVRSKKVSPRAYKVDKSKQDSTQDADQAATLHIDHGDGSKHRKDENADTDDFLNSVFDNVAPEVYMVPGFQSTKEESVGRDGRQVMSDVIDGGFPAAKDKENEGSGNRSFSNRLIETKDDGTAVSNMTERSDVHDGSSCGSVKTLFEALACTNTQGKEVEDFISSFPELAKARQPGDERFPLHVLCNRGMPDRSRIDGKDLTEYLVSDIANYNNTIRLVFSAYQEACLQMDSGGDLPIHLLARTFMVWEAGWYETVYSQASQESDPNGKISSAISKLYQSLSESIGILLQPIPTVSASLCRETGSIGRILPLHIACIFTSSVRTLRLILEAYPEAAKIPCDLSDLRTFVPDKSLPLELHEGLSTDFPKWEIEVKHERFPNMDWSQSRTESPNPEDCIRRSDLLFAYNPCIEPCRFEKTRIRRLESRIRFEAMKVAERQSSELDGAAKLLWIWMCTFQEEKNLRPTYVKSVRRIVDGLPLDSLKHLASVEVAEGMPLVEAANTQCAEIIRRSLTAVDASVPSKPPPTNKEFSVQSSLQLWDEAIESSLPQRGRSEVSLLSRRIFNIKEESFPTAFVILPYKLARNPDGKLGMASPSYAQVALKFAECLLRLTDPRSLLYFLDLKSMKHYDQSIYEGAVNETMRLEAYSKIREYEATLLGLYGYESAYLYLIDEVTGIPVVPDSEESYPIVLREPSSMVRKLLPMMLVGMILMRGDKALSVLINVLLDDSITVVAPNWIQAAKDLNTYLQIHEGVVSDGDTDIGKLQAGLEAFTSKAAVKKRFSERPRNGCTEWNVELSILKMLIDMNDQYRSFCGLRAEYILGKGVLWHAEDTEPESEDNANTDSSDDERRSEDDTNQESDYSGDSEVVMLESEPIQRNDSLPEQFAGEFKDGNAEPQGQQTTASLERKKSPKTESKPKQQPSPSQTQVMTRVEEVRRRFIAAMRGNQQSALVPDVDELTRKHEALARQRGNMTFESNYNSDSSAPLGFFQPENESSDEDHNRTVLIVDFPESSDDEAIQRMVNDKNLTDRLPVQVHESSDEEPTQQRFKNRPTLRTKGAHRYPNQNMPIIDVTEDGETSADDIQRSKEFYESTRDNRSDYGSPSVDSRRRNAHKRHSLLFDELAFTNEIEDAREPAETTRAVGNESGRVWQEITSQLDNSGMYLEDAQVIGLKAQLAEEAKKLSIMNKRVKILEREKNLILEAGDKRFGFMIETELDSPGFDASLRKARQLLVRLCILEERLLIDEIGIQHIKLETHSLDEQIGDLSMTLPAARAEWRQANGPPSSIARPSSRQPPSSIARPSSKSTPRSSSRSPNKVHFQEPVYWCVEDPSFLADDDDLSGASVHSGFNMPSVVQHHHFHGRDDWGRYNHPSTGLIEL